MKKKLIAMILSAAMAITAVPGTTAFASELDYADAVVMDESLIEEVPAEEESEEGVSEVEEEADETVDEEAAVVEEVPEEKAAEISSVSDGTFNYTIDAQQEATVVSLAADAAEITIPSAVVSDGKAYAVTAVAEDALDGNATSLTIASTVKAFGAQKLPSLASVSVEDGCDAFFVQDGVLYEEAGETNRLVLYPAASKEESFIVPENIHEIASGAFADAAYLKTVVIGKDVKKIETNAFASFANPLTVVFNTAKAPEVASRAFYLDKAIDNKFYFTSADVYEAIIGKTADFVESPFFYDPEDNEKLSDTSGVAAMLTDGLSKEIKDLLAAHNIAIELSDKAREALVGVGDISAEDAQIENGYYVISPKGSPDHYIHIKNDGMLNKDLIEVNDSTKDAVIFKVTAAGDGKYHIDCFWSNKRLGVTVTYPGTGDNAVQRDKASYNNQLWYIRKSVSDPDHVLIVNASPEAGKDPYAVLTAPTNLNGGNVTVNMTNGNDNQLWKFSAVTDPTIKFSKDNLYNIVSDADSSMAATVANKNNSTSYKIQPAGASGQRFTLVNIGYGNVFRLINFESEKTVSVSGNKKTPGADVVQYGIGTKENQVWHLVKTTASDGTDAYYVKGVGSNLYMNLAGGKTAAGTNIEINNLTGAATQKWKIVEANIELSIPLGKQIRIISKGNRSLFLNVKDGSHADNTNINVEGQNKKTDQLWTIASLGEGYYKIINVASRNALSVKSGSTAEGANIVARPFHETWNSQIWQIEKAGNDGSVYFINKHTGKYLTIKDGKFTAGTNVESYALRSDNSQKFYFTDGAVTAGWQKYGDTRRYYNADTTYKKAQFVENGNYYLDAKGLPYTGFKQYGTYYYYYKGNDGKETMDCRPYLSKLFGTRKTWNGYDAPNCSYYVYIDNAYPCLFTVYTKYKGTNSWNLPVFSFLVSPGTESTPTDFGTRRTRYKYRWKELMGPSYGQYATELLAYTHIAGSSYIDWTNNGEYFHSVACGSANDHNLNPAVYNLLGTRQSHGCVRMCVRYAWWTYTFLESGTTVSVGKNYPRPLTHVPQPRATSSIDPTDPAYTGNYGYTDTRNWKNWNGYL